MYKKVNASLDFTARETETLEFWQKADIFKKSRKLREGQTPFTFYDGPPTANGKPHIGHVLSRCYKDIILRYKTMKGFDVLRKAGWDTHGLPVELEVEKQLGLDGKEQIEGYGVEPFIAKCKESVWKYMSDWEVMSDRVGFWADMEDPYVTYHNDYIESEWWSIKRIHEQGLLYKGHKTVPYCPRCGTALSSHEVAQGYKLVTDDTVSVAFKAKGMENTYFLAWTTTPWTLPSNTLLCVNAKELYAKAQRPGDERVFILAKALVESVLGEGAAVLEEMKGEALLNTEYEPLFPFQEALAGKKRAWFVVSDPYVTLEDGTGIVHIAPAFGEDDARIGRQFDIPFLQMVDSKGQMTGGTLWDGVFVKDADPKITDYLKERGVLLASTPYEHNYPFCWRCDTPLLYYARSSWFIKMTAVKDKLMRFNRSINWLPDNIKEGRMGNFVENVVDWGLSRERYWGTPLPVWECECGHIHVVGSIAELREMAIGDVPADIELHKPFIDAIKLKCPKCAEKLARPHSADSNNDPAIAGGEMVRVKDVIDCWYDSGAMPFAQWHYPFENKELFEARYPADFITEAIDQTRGWFYTLMAISTLLFEEVCFKNCIVLGHVQDKDGQKMSKHKGNVVDPFSALDAQGADAVRWYFFTASMPWLSTRFSHETVSESQRKFMGTLWNTYAFYILYAEIDQFDPTRYKLSDCALSVMDKWVLSRLSSTISYVGDQLEVYHITEAAREMNRFVDELSNWYVRRCRERFWGKGMSEDKKAAFMTLYTVLERMARLIAPFTPFIAEQMYRNLVCSVDKSAPESVHLCDFPAPVCEIDEALEKNMDTALSIVTLGRSCRNAASMKIRQPLKKMYIQGSPLPELFTEIITSELNVKEAEYVADASGLIQYKIKPQLRTLGPRYGKLLKDISAALDTLNSDFVQKMNRGETHVLTVAETEVALTADDVLIEAQKDSTFVSEQDRDLTVVLDTALTPELIEEGFVREIVSKVQTMRKEAGFEVMDHIKLTYAGSDVISGIFSRFADEIAGEVLADKVEAGEPAGYAKSWNINGEEAAFGVERI